MKETDDNRQYRYEPGYVVEQLGDENGRAHYYRSHALQNEYQRRKSGPKVHQRLEENGYTTGTHIDFLDEGGKARIIGDLGKYSSATFNYSIVHRPENVKPYNMSIFRLAHLAQIDIADIVEKF